MLNSQRMQDKLILRVVAQAMIPFILLFGLYVQFHGDYGPGGGFQAGVIFAAGFILYGLVFGVQKLNHVVPIRVTEFGAALGLLIYTGVGVVTLILGANFLDYRALDSHNAQHGLHLGILLIEVGVGVTVAFCMLVIFQAFAGRRRDT